MFANRKREPLRAGAWLGLMLGVSLVVCAMAFKMTACAQTSGVVEDETAEVEVAETFVLYDVPLDDDLQRHIWEESREKGVPAELVLGVIRKESNFEADVVGDYGRSVGLMQIQPRWHKERMEYLGCFDMTNPFDNVTVGIDILAELLAEYQTTKMALMVYNAGATGAKDAWFDRGIYSNEYSQTVLAYVDELTPKQTTGIDRPVCDGCDAPIQGDYKYVIGGEEFCEFCLISRYRQEIPA